MVGFKFGLIFGFSIIIALGAQNIFLIRQSLINNRPYFCALLCTLCDATLVILSVTGVSQLIIHLHWLRYIILAAGITFLVVYGVQSIYRAYKTPNTRQIQSNTVTKTYSLKKTILLTLSFSLLNPHAILDNLILLGSAAGQYQGPAQQWFMYGAITASFIWFFFLVTAARFMEETLLKPRVWKFFEAASGSAMVVIACKLATQF